MWDDASIKTVKMFSNFDILIRWETKKMSTTAWRELTNQELISANTARQNGNEGRARVCARRAAGHIAGEYIARHNINFQSESALERLRFLYTSPDLDPMLHETIGHFLVHTTPDHNLPIDADLIEDVQLLARQLLGEPLS